MSDNSFPQRDSHIPEGDLAAREANLRRVVDHTIALVGVLDPNGVLLDANAVALQTGGVQRSEVIGKLFWETSWWSWDDRVAKRLQTAIEDASRGQTVRYDAKVRVAGDARIWIDFMLVPVKDPNGQVTHLIPSGVDISERYAAEQALRQSEEDLRVAMKLAKFAIGHVNYQGAEVSLSKEAASLYGVGNAPVTMSRERFHALVHPDDRGPVEDLIEACLQGKNDGLIACEHRLASSDNTIRWVDVRKQVYWDESTDPPTPSHAVLAARDITAEKEAQHELHEQRERLSLALTASRMGSFEWDPATDQTDWDEHWCQAVGLPTDAERRGESLFQLVHPEDLAGLRTALAPDPDGGDFTHEFRVVRPDGTVRWLAGSGRWVRQAHSENVRLVGMNWDITEQKEADERIRSAERRMRLAIGAAELALWQWDIEQDEITWDETLYRRQLMSPGEPLGGLESFVSLVHPDDREALHTKIKETLEGGPSYRAEFRIRRVDGTYRWTRTMAHLISRADGTPATLLGIEMDVTEQHELQESLTTLAAVAEQTPDFVGIADMQGQAIFVNAAGRRTLGIPIDQPADELRVNDFFFPEDYDRVQAVIREAMEKGQGVDEFGFRNFETEEPIDHLWNVFRIDNPVTGEPFALGTVSPDIRERKSYEKELLDAKRKAEAANAAKSEFIANMSHEIRTPMTAVLGYADLLFAGESDPEKIAHLETIQRNGHFLLEIINDILDLSKIEAGKLEVSREPFSPRQLIEEVNSIMNVRATEKGLELSVEYKGQMPLRVVSDFKRVKQILVNLVGNAIKFTESGGGVHVSVAHLTDGDEPKIRIAVADTGIGMSPDQQTKLFQPFYQGDASVTRKFGGTGLGLAISRRLVDLLGGDIQVSSKLHEGTTFTITLPVAQVDDALADQQSTSKLQSNNSSLAQPPIQLDCHVLCVDDQRDIRFLVKAFLKKTGSRVSEAEDGAIAVAQVEAAMRGGTLPDVILLDMQMPNLDGYQTAKQLREMGYNGPIIALTADAMQGEMDRCLASGCDDYLSKPIDSRLLYDRIKVHLNR